MQSGYCSKCKTYHEIQRGFNESIHFAYCPKCNKTLKLNRVSLELAKKQLALTKDEIGPQASFKLFSAK